MILVVGTTGSLGGRIAHDLEAGTFPLPIAIIDIFSWRKPMS